MEKRNSGSLSSLTGMTPPGTPKTPTEVEAEKEAEIKLQIQQLANEQVRVQKKTYTNWMNSHLKQKNMKVENLFEDIKDGVYLLSLLEVLSGEKLKMAKAKLMRAHYVSNISTALSFLEQKKVKLVNINVSDIADGKPRIVLGLMWTIILHFQIEDTFTQTATDKSGEQLPLSRSMKFRMNAKEDLLTWTGNAITKKYEIKITNFGKSWRDGLAFNALIDTINPDLVDFDQCRKQNARTNLEQAFSVANSQLGIPRLLDVEDVDVEKPDEKSVMTYVAQFVKAYPWAGVDPSKHMKVENLFEDIKDGVYLLSLLEVLSGEKLKMEKRKLRVHHLSNISTALSILEQKKIKFVNINVSDIADGKPHIVLGLMWTIILHFQIEDTFAQTATDESGEQLPLSAPEKFRMHATKDLLAWTGNAITKKYGIEITNFGKCWRDGLAFNALVHTINPGLVDFDQCRKQNARTNLEQAFSVAESQLGIPRLLDAEDVDVEKPDEKSVMTYVAQFLKDYPKAGEDPSIMATNRTLNDTSCGNMKVQDDNHPVVDSDYLHERKQDTSTVEFGVESEIRIVLIGRTGAGKSATGNTILGKIHFDSKLSASSVTSKCSRGETIQAGKKVIVVDTPGLFDTGMANETVINEIVKCIGITSPGPHAMVLVVGIGRFTKEEQDTVQHFVDKFGEGMLRYMIVLFTREDELSKSNQSIDQYVDSLPKELKEILNQCENRYVAFNNDAVGQTQREQISRFFGMVDSMQTHNGRSCYTNELYAEAEVTLQQRMCDQKEKLKKKKQEESDDITRRLEKKHAKELKKEKNELMNYEMYMKKLQNQFPDVSNIQDRRELENHTKSQQQLHAADEENSIKREKERLQREYDESKMRYEKKLEEKNKEIREQVKKKEMEYESKMNSENLRKHERDAIENESGGVLADIGNGFKRVCSNVVSGGRAVFNFFGF